MISQQELDLYNVINDLHQHWQPHAVQVNILNALFYQGKKNIFICAGRNLGKTECSAYATARWAKCHKGTESYIFGPLQNQIKEILWASKRIQNFVPKHWKSAENNTEMRITLDNGSFIKLDGADNEDSRRGIKPGGLVIYDEVKDMKLSFINSMDDNRAAKDVPAIYIGTPPEFHNHYVDLMEFAKNDPDWEFFHAPSWHNPFLSRTFLERKKRQYIAMGDEESWLREYGAVFVKGGKRHVFPQFLKYVRKTFSELWPKDLNHWHLIVGFDPGSTTTFAVGFFLYNPYNKRLMLMDEIYQQEMAKMTTISIRDAVRQKLEKFRNVGTLRFIYDEAAAWFRNELAEHEPSWHLEKSEKASTSIESGIGLLRDMFNHEMIEIAQDCVHFTSEMESYIKDEKGRLPGKNDHMIDLTRYVLEALGYEFKQEPLPKELDEVTARRGHTIGEDFVDRLTWREID